jgi:cation efflux family protein
LRACGRTWDRWPCGSFAPDEGQRDLAAAFPLSKTRDDADDRRRANRAVTVSAAGLAVTSVIELLVALFTGSAGLLGDAFHNLSDVSTSAVVFLGFRVSRRVPAERCPRGYERAEDLVGIGIAVVIWVSAALAAAESIHKIISHGETGRAGAASRVRPSGSSVTRPSPGTSSPLPGGSTLPGWWSTPVIRGWMRRGDDTLMGYKSSARARRG